MHNFTATGSGKKFHFLDPQPEEICIYDIAHALSMNCRYNGHVSEFYSVAEHSALIAEEVWQRTTCPIKALSALLHDASEAYICDIPRPVKPHLLNYEELESNIEKAIQSKFDVPEPCEVTKYLDCNIVKDEAIELFRNVPDWVDAYETTGIKLRKLKPSTAETLFLHKYFTFKTMREAYGI